MKYRYIIIFIIAIALAITAFISLSDDLVTPYVPFTKASASPGKYVQVIGKIDKTVPVKHEEGSFTFTLIDKTGRKMNFINNAVKPLNFEHADQVVALGKFDSAKNIFAADKLLIKCPSKYKKEKQI
jgi:cytochrome c-type biogenesis protein CcmE